jgi:1-acyl-sn-glycerol-3-phosphate acyltransferase
MLGQQSQLKTLIQINTQDFLTSFGLENLAHGRKALEALCWLPSRRFAHQMIHYDQQVGVQGLHTASSRMLKDYVRHLEIIGQENIPTSGPLLVLSNHPGMADTLILFSSLPRTDLQIVAAERPFLQALGNVSRHLIYVREEPGQRMSVVRNAVQHLKRGGVVLTFPAGEIEPDPASMPGALESLENWSESIAIFARMVPEMQIVPAVVSGVVWPSMLRSPLTRLRRAQKDRERLAATLQVLTQVLLPFYRPVTTRVIYGAPILASSISASSDAAGILRAITGQASKLIESSIELSKEFSI